MFGKFDAVDETDDIVAAAIAGDSGDGFDDMRVVQVIIQVDFDLGTVVRTGAGLVADELHDVGTDLLLIGAERLAIVEYNLLQVARIVSDQTQFERQLRIVDWRPTIL